MRGAAKVRCMRVVWCGGDGGAARARGAVTVCRRGGAPAGEELHQECGTSGGRMWHGWVALVVSGQELNTYLRNKQMGQGAVMRCDGQA